MKENFQLLDGGWDQAIRDAVAADRTELQVICPFIKVRTAERLLTGKRPDVIRVITRFHLGEMSDGINDTKALRLLLTNGAKIRGVKNLHSKLYLFGKKRAIVTSANLTEAALLRNHEFGFVASDDAIIQRCGEYFDSLWECAGSDLTIERLETWEKRISQTFLTGTRPSSSNGLPDEGVNAGPIQAAIIVPPLVSEDRQAFVKIFGEGNNRLPLSHSVLDNVKSSGSHWACTYRLNRRPRAVKDGDVMFMGRLVENPNDIMIYGRAIALRHVVGRDEASAAEIQLRDWKKDWPVYVRVHHGEFVSGTLKNGVSLGTLMSQLKSDSFTSTQKNARNGSGNINPRAAYSQAAHVHLTKEAFSWLNQQLEQAFMIHGKLTPAELEPLDWPTTATA